MNEAFDVATHILWFDCEAHTPIRLAAGAGGQLRGALWAALAQLTCPDPAARAQPDHALHCPLCRLMHLETVSARGANPARPLAVRPPLNPRAEQAQTLEPGSPFRFGVCLFGDAVDTINYVVQAVYRAGDYGIGAGRGRFRLVRVSEANPLVGSERTLYQIGGHMQPPSQPLTGAEVREAANRLPAHVLTLRFLTAAHIVDGRRPARQPVFSALIGRLLERCQSLEAVYTAHPQTADVWKERHFRLTEAARHVEITRDDTRWIDIYSSSGRSGFRDNIGGFIGAATFTGDLMPLRFWLAYGQLVHVGKNAIKGSGWYDLLHT